MIKKTAKDNMTYELENETGDAKMTVHLVFPGIKLIYNAIHTNCCGTTSGKKGKIIEINHCLEGRLEQQQEDAFFYIMPGDLSVTIKKEISNAYYFPLYHYHGITIIIDTEVAPKCFSNFLEDVNVQPEKVVKRLCGEKGYFILRSERYIEHIFSELYNVPSCCQRGYFKIKIMELLLILSGISPQKLLTSSVTLSKAQVQLAKEVALYLSEHIHKNTMVEELAKEFHVSPSYLQSAIKGVYGVPVMKYRRILKMNWAALQLIQTNRSVIQIAEEIGYDNASKFAAAFRDIMGETPLEYRRMHQLNIVE